MPKRTRSRIRKRNVKRHVTKKRGGMDPPSHHASSNAPPHDNRRQPVILSSVSSYHSAPPTYNETYRGLVSNSKDEEIKKLKNKLAALEAVNKIDSLCNETHEDFYMKSADCKPEPFNMENTIEQIQNMYSGLVGDRIKYATTRIAQSLRDFIMSIYEENEEFKRMNDEARRKYEENFKDNNDDWEGEQPVAVIYVCLCQVVKKEYVDVRGYLYLITTHAVYRLKIDIWTGDKKVDTPNPFQKIYQFEEPDTINNIRNNVLISYCKRNMLMVKPSDEQGSKGHSSKDIVMFCIKLESIFRVFYNPDPPSHEEAEDAYKMGRMISAHPGISEKESIAQTLERQCAKKDWLKFMKNEKKGMKNGNDGYDDVNNGMARPWTYKGEKVFRTYNGHVFRRNSENELGKYMGKYNKATNILNTSAESPYED